MTEHLGFLKDIVENPDDDTPRLIYADWLDDQGQELRARYIRLQCDLAQKLWADIQVRPFVLSECLDEKEREDILGWVGTLRLPGNPNSDDPVSDRPALHGVRYYLSRGFVEQMEIRSPRALKTFLPLVEMIFDRVPLRHLNLNYSEPAARAAQSGSVESLSTFFALPQLGRLRELTVWVEATEATCRSFANLLDNSSLTNRTRIKLTGISEYSQLGDQLKERFGTTIHITPTRDEQSLWG